MLAEQSFGMFNIHKDRTLFELCLVKKKEERSKNKKEGRGSKKMNKS